MKALITGICGFVGGYLYQHLTERGMTVCGTRLPNEAVPDFIDKQTDIRVVDLLDKETLSTAIEEWQPDVIYHLAAQSSVALSWKNPALTFNVNVNGTLHLLDAVRQHNLNCRILLIGTSEGYGKVSPEDMPIGEDKLTRPGNPYAVSKVTQEMIGKLYAEAYQMEIVMVRAFNHTGPRQTPTFVIPDFAKRLAMMEKGQMDPVLLVGNLDAIRDFSDVRDIVRGYSLLMEKGTSGEVYNIGSGQGYAIKDLLDKLLSYVSINVTVKPDQERMRPSDVPVFICDNSKISRDIQWVPEISIERTLKDVLDYWRIAGESI